MTYMAKIILSLALIGGAAALVGFSVNELFPNASTGDDVLAAGATIAALGSLFVLHV